MDRLSGDFNRGYTKAIQDVQTQFASVQYDFDAHKIRWNFKRIMEMLNVFLFHRATFREDREGFIRWNTQKQQLEFYDPKGSSMKMVTCCSMNCPFVGICRDYNFEVDRTGGCKTQDFILKKAKEIEKERTAKKDEHNI